MKRDKVLGEASIVEQQYKDGLAYKKQMGYLDKWPEYERFKAGDQWPAVTPKTKNLPRPVFNIVKYIQNHKVSSVMNENIRMVFTGQESVDEDQMSVMTPGDQQTVQLAEDAADTFTRYSDVVWEHIKQDELNEEALESAANIGTGIWHYYWDQSIQGGNITRYVGDMAGETLDAVNVFFGNPQQREVQKQPYIIISSREMLDSVKETAKANGISNEMISLIQPDKDVNDEGYDRAKVEVTSSKKVTVLTKYWKEKGTVYFMKVCSSVVVVPKTSTDINLYPIVVMQWERRKRSIFGVGDTEGLIPNQKGINLLMAMQLLSAQLTGWPKLVHKSNAVDPNKITNTPGEIIEDRSPPGTGDGVKYLHPPTPSSAIPGLVDSFIDYTKTLSSAQDAATGDVAKGQLNASAIMLLQKAAGVPIESIKKRFYRAMEDVGRIWEQFWKVKYNTTRMITVEDDDGTMIGREFEGTQYQGIDLNLKIDIGPSSSYSEQLMMASLDNLFNGGHITLDQYLEFAPKNVVPFKDRLMRQIQQRQEDQQAIEQQMAMMAAGQAGAQPNAPVIPQEPSMPQQMPNIGGAIPVQG